MILPKSDPPLGTAGVVRVGTVAPDLPKFPKGPGILKVGAVVVVLGNVAVGNAPDVVGAVGVVLRGEGAGNAPKSEGALGGSINTKMSVKSHSGGVMPNTYPFLCFP